MNIIDYNPKLRSRRIKKTLRTETRLVVRALIITLSVIIVILGIVFLASESESSQKGYTLQQVKLENEKLRADSTNIQNQITNSTAFKNIEENNKVESMEDTEEKIYVTDEDNRVK